MTDSTAKVRKNQPAGHVVPTKVTIPEWVEHKDVSVPTKENAATANEKDNRSSVLERKIIIMYSCLIFTLKLYRNCCSGSNGCRSRVEVIVVQFALHNPLLSVVSLFLAHPARSGPTGAGPPLKLTSSPPPADKTPHRGTCCKF